MREDVQRHDSNDVLLDGPDQCNDGWCELVLLTPEERFVEIEMQLANYLALGGSLAANCNVFHPDPEAPVQRPIDGKTGLRDIVIRGV